MSKNKFMKSTISNSTYMPSTINQNSSNLISNSNINQNNPNFSMFSNIDNLEDDSEFFAPSNSRARPGRIIHQTTEQSIDQKGNRVVKTRTIREIDSLNNKGRRKKKIIRKINSQKIFYNNNENSSNYYEIKTYKTSKNKNYIRISKNSTRNEAEKQKELYSSPDFLEGSPPQYCSPEIYKNYLISNVDSHKKKINTNINNYKNANTANIYNYKGNGSPGIEIISPVECIANYSSGSEYDENNNFGSCDNKISKLTNNSKKITIIRNNIKNLNYELEDPEGFDYLKNNEKKGRNLSKNSK